MQDPRRTITLLGRVAVAVPDGGADAVPRGRRAELVFAYLAAEHARQVTHDELAEALWPDGAPDTWEAALRGVLTDIRRLLADAGLEQSAKLTTARRGSQLRLPVDVSVDIDLARGAVTAARAQLAEGHPGRAAVDAAYAADLARLPFLPAHDGDWVDGVRRELTQIHASALEIGARAYAATGEFAAASAAAERLVAREPFNESAHQLRIRILGQAGDRSGAMKAYDHCRTLLEAELGVEPSDETKAVLRDASAQSVSTMPATPAASDPVQGLAVVVVEDSDFQRRTTTMLLHKLGVGSVAEAADGVAALALLAASARPDVIVCDIDMPGMDGVEFIRHVAEQDLAGAVVIASALDPKVVQAVRSVSEGYGLQVLGAVAKPLTARRLTELLAAYRRRPHADTPAADQPVIEATAARAALKDGRIAVHLQPGIDVVTGLATFADAVPRWREPASGWLSPDVFGPVLERAGLLRELFDVSLGQVCANLAAWAIAGLDLEVTVQLPAQLLDDVALADRAISTAGAHGTAPARLTFALDERALRNAPGSALDVLTRLRVKGFGVALDNFGSGNAALDQLRRVPFTQARFAAFLLSDAAADAGRGQALEAAAEVARTLDVLLVGNGCKTADDLQLLLELGCDRVLGPFISSALPSDELARWLSAWHPARLTAGERD